MRVSALSTGVGKRGRHPHVPERGPARSAAAACTAAVWSRPMSSRSFVTTSPSLRWAQPPTIRPSAHTVGPALPVGVEHVRLVRPRYQARACHPIVRGVEAGEQGHPGLGGPRCPVASSSASTMPGSPSRSTSTVASAANGPCVAPEGPARPPLEVGHRARTEPLQPSPRQLDACLGRVQLGQRGPQPPCRWSTSGAGCWSSDPSAGPARGARRRRAGTARARSRSSWRRRWSPRAR